MKLRRLARSKWDNPSRSNCRRSVIGNTRTERNSSVVSRFGILWRRCRRRRGMPFGKRQAASCKAPSTGEGGHVWPFRKKRAVAFKLSGPARTIVRVIGIMGADSIRVIVGPGVGLMDGGSHQTWPLDSVPPDLRFPNSEFFLLSHTANGQRIERIDARKT